MWIKQDDNIEQIRDQFFIGKIIEDNWSAACLNSSCLNFSSSEPNAPLTCNIFGRSPQQSLHNSNGHVQVNIGIITAKHELVVWSVDSFITSISRMKIAVSTCGPSQQQQQTAGSWCRAITRLAVKMTVDFGPQHDEHPWLHWYNRMKCSPSSVENVLWERLGSPGCTVTGLKQSDSFTDETIQKLYSHLWGVEDDFKYNFHSDQVKKWTFQYF